MVPIVSDLFCRYTERFVGIFMTDTLISYVQNMKFTRVPPANVS